MSTFKAPEGATSVSTQQQEFEVVNGVFAVPDQFDVHLLAVGFKRTAPVAVVEPVDPVEPVEPLDPAAEPQNTTGTTPAKKKG
ncbi:hypothetical protein P3T40_003399 [Paraburkholderia sp. EB58]|jgi:hypothetical protein|uniref:hypothetical protein n=1 Tax=Paraburkholderia sp. EB58 TaxID=3035125 RepID=UPI003D259AD2